MDLSRFSIPVQAQAQGNLKQQEPAVEPAVKGITLKISRISIELFQRGDLMEHPFAVTPPQPSSSIVMVCGLIGEAVVMAVEANPFDRSALASKRAHDHQHAFQPNGNHKAAVRD
jgi:hypothetical protein